MTQETSRNRIASSWGVQRERGSRLALRFLVWGIRAMGYRRLRLILAPIATYYCLFAGPARRASQDYLSRIASLESTFETRGLRTTFLHIYRFAEGILDRLALWSGSIDDFEVTIHGREHLEALVRNKRGAFLVGAHIGSFDVLRVVARDAKIPVNVIMYSANAERINEAFETLDPEINVRVIESDPASIKAGFEVKGCIERGEFVAILADRIPPGGKQRVSIANFLGRPAAFPQGPFLVPVVLRIPTVLTLAIRTGPRVYDVYFEPLGDGEPVPARRRAEVVQERVERFASRLEHYCRRYPLQWFNFYDFWAGSEDASR